MKDPAVRKRRQVLEFEDFLIFHDSGIPLYYHKRVNAGLPLDDPVLKGGFLCAMMQFAKSYGALPTTLYDFGFGSRRVFLIHSEPYYFAITLKKMKTSTRFETIEKNVKELLTAVKQVFCDLIRKTDDDLLHDEKGLEEFKKNFHESFVTILERMGFESRKLP